MTYAPLNTIGSYLPIEFEIPDDFKVMQELIAKRERMTASIVNIKENGSYDTQELLTAQQWFSVTPPAQQKVMRYTFRKVVDIGALTSPGTTTVPHGIVNVTNTWIFTKIMAVARNSAATLWIPITYSDGTNSATMTVDATNVNIITNTAFFAAFTQCYAVLEYIKQ